MNIGLLGAIGVEDIGDIIMLESNLRQIDNIRKVENLDIKVLIFAINKQLAIEQIKNMDIDIDIEVVDTLEKEDVSTKLEDINHTFDYMDYVYNYEFISNIKKCHKLYFIGGGYLNSSWGYKNLTKYLLPIKIATQNNIKIYVTGINFGPYEEEELELISYFLENVNITLNIRDVQESYIFIDKLKRYMDEKTLTYNIDTIESCDDLLYSWYESNIMLDKNYDDKYAVIQLHHWAEKYSKNYITMYQQISLFLNYLIDEEIVSKVYFIPFSLYKGVDYECGRRLEFFMDNDRYVLLEPSENYINIHNIIKNAEVVIGSRYHPIVFGLSNNVNSIGIIVNNLYNQKIGGLVDTLDLLRSNYLIKVNDITLDNLLKIYDKQIKSNLDTKDIVNNFKNEREINNFNYILN